jgi:hypothetical protein
MALGPGQEHASEIEEGVGAMGGLDLAGNTDRAALVGEKFDGYVGWLGRRGVLVLAGGIGTALVALGSAAVIGTTRGTVGAPAFGFASAGGGIASRAAFLAAIWTPIITARAGVSAVSATWALAAAWPAAAIVLATAATPVATGATPGAAIGVLALVVGIRILRGWLFEPVRHQLEVEVRGQFGHGVIE